MKSLRPRVWNLFSSKGQRLAANASPQNGGQHISRQCVTYGMVQPLFRRQRANAG